MIRLGNDLVCSNEYIYRYILYCQYDIFEVYSSFCSLYACKIIKIFEPFFF